MNGLKCVYVFHVTNSLALVDSLYHHVTYPTQEGKQGG